jgi:hypothetical protein
MVTEDYMFLRARGTVTKTHHILSHKHILNLQEETVGGGGIKEKDGGSEFD